MKSVMDSGLEDVMFWRYDYRFTLNITGNNNCF